MIMRSYIGSYLSIYSSIGLLSAAETYPVISPEVITGNVNYVELGHGCPET